MTRDDADPGTAAASGDAQGAGSGPLPSAVVRSGPARATFGSRRVTRVALVALVAVCGLAAVADRHAQGGAGTGLTAAFQAAPGARLDQSADLDELDLELVLTNPGRTARAVDRLQVTGLGEVIDAVVPGTVRIGGGDSVRIPIAVDADCGSLGRVQPSVVVNGVRAGGPSGDLQALLAPMCPPTVAGLAVDVVAARGRGGDTFAVRLVNHGGAAAAVVATGSASAGGPRLVTTPALPLALVPGAAATVQVRAEVPTCPVSTGPVAAGSLSVQAATAHQDVPVGHWPSSLEAAALEQAGRDCPPG